MKKSFTPGQSERLVSTQPKMGCLHPVLTLKIRDVWRRGGGKTIRPRGGG